MNKKSKQWVIGILTAFVMVLFIAGGFVMVVDPYFHYHAPQSFVKYELNNERYQNNGIVKHFDYDAIITGSSMTQCFRPSELDELFSVNAIKVPFSGGSFKEVNENLKVALKYNSDIKMVVRGLDVNALFNDKDLMNYDNFPTYLYDDTILNDASYLFNKSILITSIQNLRGYLATKSTYMSMDDYMNWSNYMTYGKEAALRFYNRDEIDIVEEMLPITEEDYEMMEDAIAQNITSTIAKYPDTEFYIYFTPYSIFYMDFWHRSGELHRYMMAQKFYTEKLLEYENVHVFSFFSDYETICDLNNYKDLAHHRGELNSQILIWMKEGKYELTKENYEEYYNEIYDYYMNFDYDLVF